MIHPDLTHLSLAHIDCDAFYASVEKRDNPSLADRPVIVGGGKRGVVAAACYIARSYGVRSAMPMFKALALCPQAVVIRPDMAKYSRIGREIRQRMLELTPLVEPLSIDEAFLDLSGTQSLHGGCPAQTLASFARRIETDLGLSVSIGLSYCKLLAKIASDLDKPRGFAVLGPQDGPDFLARQPVSILWGVGKATLARMDAQGIRTVGDLLPLDLRRLMADYGQLGQRLHAFARGIDPRPVKPDRPAKSISAETTFDRDIDDRDHLARELWPMAETVARRLKRADRSAWCVSIRLKAADFSSITRAATLPHPTQRADLIWRTGVQLLEKHWQPGAYRLIGIGVDRLDRAALADPADLVNPQVEKRRKVEQAIDAVRAKLGDSAIAHGRSLGTRRRLGTLEEPEPDED